MHFLSSLGVFVASAVESRFSGYLEHHHWLFGMMLIVYIFHLHDRSLHARFDVLDKPIDEIRKRLACNG
jgi:hypothetical protein